MRVEKLSCREERMTGTPAVIEPVLNGRNSIARYRGLEALNLIERQNSQKCREIGLNRFRLSCGSLVRAILTRTLVPGLVGLRGIRLRGGVGVGGLVLVRAARVRNPFDRRIVGRRVRNAQCRVRSRQHFPRRAATEQRPHRNSENQLIGQHTPQHASDSETQTPNPNYIPRLPIFYRHSQAAVFMRSCWPGRFRVSHWGAIVARQCLLAFLPRREIVSGRHAHPTPGNVGKSGMTNIRELLSTTQISTYGIIAVADKSGRDTK